MALPDGALLDPALEDLDLGLGELLAGLGRGHEVVVVGRRDALPDFALLEAAGHDGVAGVAQRNVMPDARPKRTQALGDPAT